MWHRQCVRGGREDLVDARDAAVVARNVRAAVARERARARVVGVVVRAANRTFVVAPGDAALAFIERHEASESREERGLGRDGGCILVV